MLFIPLEYYTDFFYHATLVLVVYTFFFTQINAGKELLTVASTKVIGGFLCIWVILYMGLRPISGCYFGDMAVYAHSFELQKFRNYSFDVKGEWFFIWLEWFCAQSINKSTYFLICASIYIIPLFIACKRWFGKFYYYGFILCLGAYPFWAYGVNGIRNGMATSLVILAFSFKDWKMLMVMILLLAVGTHHSTMLPIVAFFIGYLYRDTKIILLSWLLSIPISLIAGGAIEPIFAGLGFGDDRFAAYLTSEEFNSQFSSVGFRWDFLAFSAVPVYMGYHYIFQKGFVERFYIQFFNTYLISNAFWVLVIRASFSNRFAYLSWFMIPIVIIYPLLKKRIWPNQYSRIGLIIVLHFAFTYFMNYILENI